MCSCVFVRCAWKCVCFCACIVCVGMPVCMHVNVSGTERSTNARRSVIIETANAWREVAGAREEQGAAPSQVGGCCARASGKPRVCMCVCAHGCVREQRTHARTGTLYVAQPRGQLGVHNLRPPPLPRPPAPGAAPPPSLPADRRGRARGGGAVPVVPRFLEAQGGGGARSAGRSGCRRRGARAARRVQWGGMGGYGRTRFCACTPHAHLNASWMQRGQPGRPIAPA